MALADHGPALGAHQVSPAGSVTAIFPGWRAEEPSQDRRLAVAKVVGRGQQRYRAGSREGA